MKKTYRGGCHCGAVRFEVDIDLAKGTVRCNCSICTKDRNWLAAVGGDSFRLLDGEGELSDYQFGRRKIHHMFCRRCGVRSFSWAPQESGRFYAVHVTCLDDAPVEELVEAPVTYVDGRNDDFKAPPAETRHL